MSDVSVRMRTSDPKRSNSMDHYFEGYDQAEDQYGRPLLVWTCACGRRGKGSRTVKDAKGSFVRHFRGRVRAENY